MSRQRDEVWSIMREDGVIARRQHQDLAGALDRLTRTGDLVPVLPGVYARPELRDRREARLAALARWAPEAVLVDATATQQTYWPKLLGTRVECALPWDREPRRGFLFSRRRIPPELVVRHEGFWVTTPSLTALDLCERYGGEGIDRGLLTRTVTLASLRDALDLTAGRPGNTDRRTLLLDSRDKPWSEAERLCHRLLRAAKITDWKANYPVRLKGQKYFLDVAFPTLRLVLEIDGRLHEDDEDVFESDRWRQNALVLDGWTVLRFTWKMLTQHPEAVIEIVLEALGRFRSAR